MNNLSEKLTQEQIDKIVVDLCDKDPDEIKALKPKDNMYICRYCKRRAAFKDKLKASFIFGNSEVYNCSNEYGHVYISWAYMILQKGSSNG